MNKYVELADKAIKECNNSDIDEYLAKMAKDNSLNADETQRLVEEYNVGKFLEKMSDGSHHEDFKLATPVKIASNDSTSSVCMNMEKTASDMSRYSLNESMFNDLLPNENILAINSGLLKTASAEVDYGLFSSEDAWAKADTAREIEAKEYNEGIDRLSHDDSFYNNVSSLMKIASVSEGLTKTFISLAAKAGNEDLAHKIMEDSKYSSSDILNSKVEAFPIEANHLIASVIA